MSAEIPIQDQPPDFSQRSQRVLEVLAERSTTARDLYVGAIRVLADKGNPVSARQAAYAVREVMVELDKAAGVVPLPGLKARVEKLRDHWTAVKNAPRPSGESVDALQRFSAHLNEFFDAYEEEYPGQVERARATIRELDPAKANPPPAVETPRAQAFVKFRQDFNSMLHGGRRAAQEFDERLEGLEEFLLDWFQPRTFDDFDELDSLIDKGPPGD